VVGSELAIFGYPPLDLLDSKSKVDEQLYVFDKLRRQIGDVGLIIGVAERNFSTGKPLFNNALFIQNREVVGRRSKELLPTYDVFDERRYFQPGPRKPSVVSYLGKRIAILNCEDAWSDTENSTGSLLYDTDPVEDAFLSKPDILVVINASPYYWGKGSLRFKLFSKVAKRVGCSVIYVNQVGGNDNLIFDGRSFGVWETGRCRFAAPAFEECEAILNACIPGSLQYDFDEGDLRHLYKALVLGVRDYARKTGFKKVVIGESGGIDSALTTCIAVDAVGKENVTAIGMPSPFSSGGSVKDAQQLCFNLGVRFEIIPIGGIYEAFGAAVNPVIGWRKPEDFGKDVTEENVQARMRGMILMAYSNRTGALVLSTGNKSELAVGYCTLYGDMVGGLAVISDVPKTLVYSLAHYVNRDSEIIPRAIIGKAPSAELRPDQKDQDSLPSYDVLDKILHLYVEVGMGEREIIAAGGIPEVDVKSVLQKVVRNEYKRMQAAPGLKVTTKAFGSGRRIPIAAKPLVDQL
jgi:NAD+ synthetase